MNPFPPNANIITGFANPDSSIGHNGDYFVNMYTNYGFGPKVGLNWGFGYYLGITLSSGSGVTSVNGFTGVVTLTTSDVPEGTNLYFTNTKARAAFSAGTDISLISGVITNTAPDQTVVLTNGSGIGITGTYPSFTITNNSPDQTVVLTNGTGISISGTYPNFTITNTAPFIGTYVTSVSGTTNRITSSGGTTPVINISSSYIGQTSITTLGTITTGDWNGTAITDTYINSSSTWNAKQDALSGTGIVYSTSGLISYINGTSSQFVKADGSLDLNTYLTGNQTITLTGAVTGSGATSIATTLANSIVGIANLSATGTPSSLTYLRGDNTWATITIGSGTVTTVSIVSANGFAGSVATATTTPAITLSTTITGILKGNGIAISAATSGTDYEVPLTFSTGLTRSTNTVTVNTSQNIAKLTNLTSNGFVKTSSGDGTLIVDTTTYQTQLNGTGFVKASGTTITYDNSTYLTANQAITLSGDVSGSGSTSITTTLATVNSNIGTFGSATQVAQYTVNGKGLITATSNVSIQIAESQVTNLVADLAGKQATLTAGTGVNISSNVVRANDVVYKVPSTINLKATGNTTVFTTEASKGRFFVREVRVHMVTLSGAGSAAQVSIGVVPAGYIDIVNSTALNSLSTVNQYANLTLQLTQLSLAPSTAVVFRVATAATYATANTGDVYITGWYEQF